MAKVEIFHNVAKDEEGLLLGFAGYEPGHELVKVFEFDVDANEVTDARQLAEKAFALGNGQDQESEDYYSRRLRSLSVGDLVKIGLLWLWCEPSAGSPLPITLPTTSPPPTRASTAPDRGDPDRVGT